MAFLKTIMQGRIGASEKYTCSISWGIFGLAPDSPDQAMVDGILARLLTFTTFSSYPSTWRDLASTNGAMTGWRVELRAEDESILSLAEGLLSPELGGNIAPTKTPQDSLVVSLRTATPGARGRGRFYLPAQGAVLDSTFQLSSPSRPLIASQARTWLNAIGGEINAYFDGVGSILSVVLAVRSTTDHTCRDVTSLQIGSVLDTQRRRRDALPEAYSTVSYP